jgi:hypothetical protein
MRSRVTVHVLALSFGTLAVANGHDARASEAPPDATPPPGEAAPRGAIQPQAFGDRGELVIGTDANASVSTQSYDGARTSVVIVDPSVDYFAARHLSIGGALLFSYQTTGGASPFHDITYGIAPRIGYDIPLSDHFSLWPKASAFFTRTHSTIGGTLEPATDDQSNVAVELFAPVLYHPAPHFFVGFGPYAETYLTGTNETFVGAKLTLGGWLGV